MNNQDPRPPSQPRFKGMAQLTEIQFPADIKEEGDKIWLRPQTVTKIEEVIYCGRSIIKRTRLTLAFNTPTKIIVKEPLHVVAERFNDAWENANPC